MRRLAAILYDALLVFALLMAAAMVVVLVLRDAVNANNLLFQLYLLIVAWAYFALSWRGGQSLGMKAWRVYLVGRSEPISWLDTGVRFLVAILSWTLFGLGFLWSLFNRRSASWHDLASGSRLLVRPRAIVDASKPDSMR